MNKRAKITLASDLPVRTLRRILQDTESLTGPDDESVRALRRALTKARRRAVAKRKGAHRREPI
jgi:hypothetical protein